MKFFVEQVVVFFHFVKYFGKDSTNISRVILSGPYYPVAHFAPVSPTYDSNANSHSLAD